LQDSTQWRQWLHLPWPHRTSTLCVAFSKSAKASAATVAIVGYIAGGFKIHFANVNIVLHCLKRTAGDHELA